MSDDTILGRIAALLDREHQLRADRSSGSIDEEHEHSELRGVEVELDQCWDLLRQRRARREFGSDPEEAAARPASVVEKYWQ